MKKNEVIDIWRKRLNWVLTTLFFFALPAYFLAFGLGRICQSQTRDFLESKFNELDSILFKIGKSPDSLDYYSSLLNRLGKAAALSHDRRDVLQKEILLS